MSKKQIDKESEEIQRTVRLLMSTVVLAGLLARGKVNAYSEAIDDALAITDELVEKAGGLPL